MSNSQTNMDAVKLKTQLIIHEGYRSQVYRDSVGNRTVGVGFNLERLDAVGCLQRVNANYHEVVTGKSHLTEQQIDRLLTCGINKVEAEAKDYVANYDKLDDVRQRVICDMIFNLGLAGFLKFEKDLKDTAPSGTPESELGTIDLVEDNRFREAATRMLKTKWAKQVGKRAQVLSHMMATGEDVYNL